MAVVYPYDFRGYEQLPITDDLLKGYGPVRPDIFAPKSQQQIKQPHVNMQRLNLKAMAAMEKATLPKFEKAIKAVQELPIDNIDLKNDILNTLISQSDLVKAEILKEAWSVSKPATRKPRKAKEVAETTEVPPKRTRKPRKQISLFDQAIESGDAVLIDTDDDL